jgi:hypothetical protein
LLSAVKEEVKCDFGKRQAKSVAPHDLHMVVAEAVANYDLQMFPVIGLHSRRYHLEQEAAEFGLVQ